MKYSVNFQHCRTTEQHVRVVEAPDQMKAIFAAAAEIGDLDAPMFTITVTPIFPSRKYTIVINDEQVEKLQFALQFTETHHDSDPETMALLEMVSDLPNEPELDAIHDFTL